jgi:hypothetical protein
MLVPFERRFDRANHQVNACSSRQKPGERDESLFLPLDAAIWILRTVHRNISHARYVKRERPAKLVKNTIVSDRNVLLFLSLLQ